MFKTYVDVTWVKYDRSTDSRWTKKTPKLQEVNKSMDPPGSPKIIPSLKKKLDKQRKAFLGYGFL